MVQFTHCCPPHKDRPLSYLAFWSKSLAAVLHTQGRPLSHMGFLVQVTHCCPPHHTRSSFVSPGPFVTSHMLLSSTHKIVLYLTWAFWYKSLAAVIHTQVVLCLIWAFWYKSFAAVLHTQGRLLSPGPFGTSHSLLSSTHKVVFCLTLAF
jgi:hypothetical protein